MPPSAGTASRPWSRFARASGNASGASAAWPAGCVSGTTTGRTIWPTFPTGGRVLRHRKLSELRAEPEGNGVAERFIRTLKENVLWVRSFETIEELRLALLEFKRTYNEHWMLEKYDYRSPALRRPPWAGRGGVEANTVKPLSKNPEAVHWIVQQHVAEIRQLGFLAFALPMQHRLGIGRRLMGVIAPPLPVEVDRGIARVLGRVALRCVHAPKAFQAGPCFQLRPIPGEVFVREQPGRQGGPGPHQRTRRRHRPTAAGRDSW